MACQAQNAKQFTMTVNWNRFECVFVCVWMYSSQRLSTHSWVVCGFGPHLHNQLDQVIYDCILENYTTRPEIKLHTIFRQPTHLLNQKGIFCQLKWWDWKKWWVTSRFVLAPPYLQCDRIKWIWENMYFLISQSIFNRLYLTKKVFNARSHQFWGKHTETHQTKTQTVI